MALNIDGLETFTLLPLELDPSSKNIITSSNTKLQKELGLLNELHQAFLNIKTPVPPPPVPVNPKHSANISKLRDSGNNAFRLGKHHEALRIYTLALEMAWKRPLWEPCDLFRDEVANLYANRSQVHMSLQNWPEGAIDAEASIEAKKSGNTKAWWRRGKCLLEMQKIDEAMECVERGLEMEGHERDLTSLLREIKKRHKKDRRPSPGL